MAPSIIVPTRSVNGVRIPTVGYGTMLFPDPEGAVELIQGALECGYRHLDTARKYGSEEWVGAGIRASGLAREDIWVTTKVTEENAKADDFKRSVDTSLKTMGLDYVDLLLIHWPQPKVPLEETLGALAQAKRDGLAKNIGVSNFTVALLDEAATKCPEPLLTNQIEYHAYIRQDKVIAACRQHGLLVSCHVPLARGAVVKDPVLREIAKSYDKTAAQIALKWLIQQPDTVVVPRALALSQIRENIDLDGFELSPAEMKRISGLRERNLRIVDPNVRRPVWDEG